MSAPTLFPVVKTAPKPKRVLMHLHDAGAQGYSQWKCRLCARTVEAWFEDDDWSSNYREPCPWCGPTWGRIQASRTEVVPAPSGKWDPIGGFVPDGEMNASKRVPIVKVNAVRQKFAVGDAVRVNGSEPWTGTVRAKSTRLPGTFRVDNGSPEDPGMGTNGWTTSAWVGEDLLEALEAAP